MSEENQKINMMELLLQISNDVSSIKTDMANIKESQQKEKANTDKAIADLRADYERELHDLESSVTKRINDLTSVQNTIVGDVDTLKKADDKKDAKKWRRVTAYICTALGAFIVAQLPEIIKTLWIAINVSGGK